MSVGIRNRIETRFKSPTFLQFSRNGDWENAFVIPATARINQKVWQSFQPVDAAEIVFGSAPNPIGFIGVRLASGNWNRERIERTLGRSSLNSITELELASGVESLFKSAPVEADVGVYNRWKSFGSATVWRKGDPTPSVDELAKALPFALRESRDAPLMIEVIFRRPVWHWAGFNISEKTVVGYHLSLRKLSAALGEILP